MDSAPLLPPAGEEIDLIKYIRILRKYRKPIVKYALGLTLIVLIIQIVRISFPPLQNQPNELSTLVTIGRVNNIPIQDIKEKLSIISTLGVQHLLLNQLKQKDVWWTTFRKLPLQSFTIQAPTDTLAIITVTAPKQGHQRQVLLDVLTDYITADHKNLFKKQMDTIEYQINTLTAKRKLLEGLLKDYQTTRNALNRTINNLSPSNEANAQTFQAYIPSRDEVSGKIDTYTTQLLDINNELLRLNRIKEEAMPTSIEIVPSVPSSRKFTTRYLIPLPIAFIIGLILGGIGACTTEWWNKNRVRL